MTTLAERTSVWALLERVFPLLTKRSKRVLLLLIAILAMSAVDLHLTLLYLTHSGLNELNPLARALMHYQSPFVLAIWKALTVSLSVGILVLIRHKRSAELGAWAACGVLGLLMSHWVIFVRETSKLNLDAMRQVAASDPTWVIIESPPTRVTGVRTIID